MRRTVSGLLARFVLPGPRVGGWQLLETTHEVRPTATLSLVSVAAVLLTALAFRLPAGERPPRGLHQGRGPRPEPLSVPSRAGNEGAPHQGSERP